MNKTDKRKKKVLEALENSLGVVTLAVKNAGISRSTFYQWMNDDAEFKKNVEDVSEIALDFVESKLFKQIKEDNTASTIFYLKTKGKKRGYVERTEHSFDKDVNISFED